MESCKSICTHLSQNEKFSKDEGVEKVDVTAHRSIIGCLMFLTATRPDIMFPDVVAQSTAEAECVAPALAVNQALWLRKLLTDLKMIQEEATTIFVDN
nr:Copia protein [Ipomoea batatas]